MPDVFTVTSNPAEVRTVTIGGKTFRAGMRTIAHLQWTIEQLAKRFPMARLEVIQGSYNSGVAASAGTHDFDGVLDVRIVGLDWWVAQKFLRQCGWAAWFRHTGDWAAPSAWHIHMISIGCPGPVGIFIPGQLDDYFRHSLGLKGQHDSGLDDSWFPPDINATIFDFPQYLRDQEDAVPYLDWPAAHRQALNDDLVAALANSDRVATKNADVLLAKPVDDDPATNVKQALRRSANG